MSRPILIATRGSALALAQANFVMAQCRDKFPDREFDLKIIKTTGDKLQTASMSQPDKSLPRGLFTKELETALLTNEADLAVHSLKDLPTQLPDGLKLGGVAGARADVRDVLIYRNRFLPQTRLSDFPAGLTVATSSVRRKAQLLAHRPDFNVIEIRGNVPTRIKKLSENPELGAIVLALAGLHRLDFQFAASGELRGAELPAGLTGTVLDTNEMLPCVGQGALGVEIRQNDSEIDALCEALNHPDTYHCVLAERALLRALGGGCQAPLGAHASIDNGAMHMRAVSFMRGAPHRAELTGPRDQAEVVGVKMAQLLS